MLKLIIGFVVLAAVTLFVLMKGGEIDLSGEHGAQEAIKSEAPAK